LLKILPQDDDRQRVVNLSWRVEPEGVLWRVSDGFGNQALAGFIEPPHEKFCFGITGAAEISDKPYITCREPERVLLYPSELTRPEGGLADFYGRLAISAPNDAVERVGYFSRSVHAHMNYARGVTTSSTTAQEAFDMGTGVCQDYAHILLALLRLDKIPCRYVAGLASDYGETHAWVEAWLEKNERFYGLDPTRDKFVDEGYISLSKGRDFKDCSVERGVYKGVCKGEQKISLIMEEAQ
jgi:transglutaminase-like putative cysteine protease